MAFLCQDAWPVSSLSIIKRGQRCLDQVALRWLSTDLSRAGNAHLRPFHDLINDLLIVHLANHLHCITFFPKELVQELAARLTLLL